jgi:hypothetical protein|tara:strand:- start:122 stop:292 length:171 start_codon:yes stop_codon:yes gene_type:complete
MKESRTISTIGIIIAAAILSRDLVSLGKSIEQTAGVNKSVRLIHEGNSKIELNTRP